MGTTRLDIKRIARSQAIGKTHRRLVRALLALRFRPTSPTGYLRLGSGYGGWWVPSWAVREGAVAYCVGVGEDATFDFELAARGMEVHSFDPTPRAQAYMEAMATMEGVQVTFHPIGVWSENTTLRFHAPTNPEDVSHSITDRGTGLGFDAKVETLLTIAEELGHSDVTLVKLDIEGAEHEVIAELLESEFRPEVLCMELDKPTPMADSFQLFGTLKSCGYRLCWVDGWNYTFEWRLDAEVHRKPQTPPSFG